MASRLSIEGLSQMLGQRTVGHHIAIVEDAAEAWTIVW